jgi:hypothetical protein
VESKSPKKENLQVGDYDFEAVDRFIYLGSLITNRNTVSGETQCRITDANKCYYELQKQLKSKQLKRNIKFTIYKIIIIQVLFYGSETWTLRKTDEKKLRTFENKVLRNIYGPVYDGYWRRRYNTELHKLFQKPDLVKIITISRLRWLGHLVRMTNNPPARRITEGKPWSRRRVERPCLRWMDGVTEDLHRKRIGNWKDKAEIDGYGEISYRKPVLTKSCSAADGELQEIKTLKIFATLDKARLNTGIIRGLSLAAVRTTTFQHFMLSL